LNDNNKDCCETLKKNHKDANVLCCDMDDIDISPYIGKVDLLCGGIHCQSFSQAGKRKGFEDPRGQLIFKFIEMINTLTPKIFLIENVKGIVSHDSGNTLTTIIDILKNQGYTIQYKVLNAFDYEVPQKRERIFIIGTRPNISFNFPEKSKHKVLLKDVLMNVPNSKGSKYSQEKEKLYDYIPQGGCWINRISEKVFILEEENAISCIVSLMKNLHLHFSVHHHKNRLKDVIR
jgi:DNA (cytosine-5)-methyltransferase 1